MAKHVTPIQSIRKYCLDCSNDQPKEVRYCNFESCALYPFRLGTNPNYKKKELTEEEKKKLSDRFNKRS
jgi:hypothetical protein